MARPVALEQTAARGCRVGGRLVVASVHPPALSWRPKAAVGVHHTGGRVRQQELRELQVVIPQAPLASLLVPGLADPLVHQALAVHVRPRAVHH